MHGSLSAGRLGGRLFCVSDPKVCFEDRDALKEVGDFPPQDVDPLFELIRETWRTFDKATGLDVGIDPRLAVNFGSTADAEMAGQTSLTTDDDEILDHRAARNADLGADKAVLTNSHVVGNLDKIVDFGPLSYHRLAKASAVQRGVGANFYVVLDHDVTDLRDFFMAAVGKFIAKAIGADHHAGLKPHPFAQDALWRNDAAGHQPTIPSDDGISTDKNLSLKMDLFTNFNPLLDHAKGTDRRRGRNSHTGSNNRGRVQSRDRARPKLTLQSRTNSGQPHRRIFNEKISLVRLR